MGNTLPKITAESAIAFVQKLTMPEAIAYDIAREEMLAAVKKCRAAAIKLLDAVEPSIRDTLEAILRDEVKRELG